ncbi:MAG TPA: spore germination protein GerW family protein [Ruminiclostridium sp.]
MEQNSNLNQNIDTLFSNLEAFTQNEGMIGKPVTHGDKTFLPIVSVTLGYGSGNSASKPQQGTASASQGMGSVAGATNMAGGALGLGAKLCTDAIIVIDKDKVSMMPLNATANAGQFMDKIPEIISGMTSNKQQGQQQGQQQQQQQQNQPQGQQNQPK